MPSNQEGCMSYILLINRFIDGKHLGNKKKNIYISISEKSR